MDAQGVITATCGMDGVAIHRFNSKFHVIFYDFMMPGMSGGQPPALITARHVGPRVHTVFVTGRCRSDS